jgi:hypothetical protein
VAPTFKCSCLLSEVPSWNRIARFPPSIDFKPEVLKRFWPASPVKHLHLDVPIGTYLTSFEMDGGAASPAKVIRVASGEAEAANQDRNMCCHLNSHMRDSSSLRLVLRLSLIGLSAKTSIVCTPYIYLPPEYSCCTPQLFSHSCPRLVHNPLRAPFTPSCRLSHLTPPHLQLPR